MKFILIAAVALLALAHGSYAQDATELEKVTQFLDDMKTKMTRDLTELLNSQDLANTATSFLANKREELEPMVAQFQEQMKTAATSVEEHIRPLAANVQAQAQPLFENFQQQVEAILKKMMDQTQALGN